MRAPWVVLLSAACAREPVRAPVADGAKAPPVASAVAPPPDAAGSTSAAPEVRSDSASTSSAACRPWPSPARWSSLYGASLGLTEEWTDLTSYFFSMPGERKRSLSFSTSPEIRHGYVENQRKTASDAFGEKQGRKIGPVRTTKTALGPAEHFEFAFGASLDSEALVFAALLRASEPLALQLRGTRRDVAHLPALLASLEELPPGALLAPPGRHAVYGSSFTWPEPLLPPAYFSFESEDGARLRLHWEDAAPPFEDVDWDRYFSLPKAPAPADVRIRHGAVPGPAVCPPPGFAGEVVAWRHFAQEGRAPDYDGISKLHVFVQAHAPVGKRFLVVEYFDEDRERSTLERVYELLRTVHAEEPR